MLAAKNITWHETAEIVVVGYGLAGAAAAITAHDKGAKVVMLEKQPAGAMYSCSALSGGVFICPTNAAEAARYLTATCNMFPGAMWTDADAIDAWAKYTVQNKEWFESMGAAPKMAPGGAEHPKLPGAGCIQIWRVQGSGIGMMNLIYKNVEKRKIPVFYETRATRLITNAEGQIAGVSATAGESQKELNFKATKGVILCSGGFEFDEDMKLQYLKAYPVYFSAGIANTGDGIKMAQEVGADLWHMNCVSARLVAKFPEVPLSMTLEFNNPATEPKNRFGYIIVNKHGERFTSENLQMHGAFYELTQFDSHKLEYPRIPSYVIFDQRRFKAGPVAWRASGAPGPAQIYHWSLDNSEELKKGWIIKAETLKDLAEKMGLPAETVEKSVQNWNLTCQQTIKPEFPRKSEDLIPIDSPPYYSVPLYPGGPNTQGGPRRNGKAQVVNPFGKPIAGLYAAGEMGSIYGMLYPAGGGNLAECIAFGRIAAENAIKENPKS